MISFLLPLLYVPVFYFAFADVFMFAWFVVGVLGGVFLMWIDEKLLFRYYTEATQVHLITRSPMFIAAYVPLAVFVITSSGSAIGVGLIQGIGLLLTWELLKVRKDPVAFNARFYQEQHQVTHQESMWISVGIAAFFVVISLMIFL
jgi:hypothetical protein